MNKAQMGVKGFALLTAFMIFMIALFITIDPLKEQLDGLRDSSSLNCPGTDGFNETAYENQTEDEQLQKRPVCFVTGLSMVWFVGAFIIASVIWLYRNWGGK